MQLLELSRYMRRSLFVVAFAISSTSTSNSWAISPGQIDDFQDGTSQNWGYGGGNFPVEPVGNIADSGPSGIGDRALFMDSSMYGGGRLLVVNQTQWLGDWTTSGITQISLDVRNPNTSPLSLRLGIAGPGGVSPMGGGDTYVTNALNVPADNEWHTVAFDVTAPHFVNLTGTDIDAALSEVTNARFLNSANPSFVGEFGGAFYLDNIRALPVPEPGTLALAFMGFSIFAVWRWNDHSATKKS